MEYGLIGYPLKHSFSKEIHGLIGGYDYSLCEIKKDNLAQFLLKRDFKGLNVTIPYKQEVMKYLDEIDPRAKEIGAVNTIVNNNGILKGYNTDFYGMLSLINKIQYDIKGKNVLILGTGGTSNTAYALCQYLKANLITKVTRSENSTFLSYNELDNLKDNYQVIINTTPHEMYPHNDEQLLVDLNEFKNLQAVFDVVYNPINTKLVLQTKERNIKTVGGLYMLVGQAVYANALFMNKEPDDELIDKIFNKVLFQKRNIVLIGMPSCGKTTIGKNLADKLNRDFYDIDDIVIKNTGKKICDIFRDEKEISFRRYEEDAVGQIYKYNGVIISTGGGTILKKENINMLRQNGLLVFLDRDIDKLMPDSDRPLASSFDKIKEIYKQRYQLYCDCADIIIKNNGTIDSTINKILAEIKK